MTFGFPLAFWFGLLALPILAAFFYRRRANERVIPALEIWEMLGIPVSSKSISSLLRRILSLLAQLLLLALLVIALADPSPAKKRAGRTIIVMDVSATLQTREGNSDRMAAVKGEALRALADIPADGEAVVVRAAHTPMLAQGITRSIADARRAVETTESLDTDSDLTRGIEAARAFLDPQIRCDVIVISDFAGLDPATLRKNWGNAGQLKLVQIGQTVPDAAITGVWAEQRGGGRRIIARIAQSSLTGKIVPVRLNVEGRLVDTKSVTLEDKPVQVEFTQPVPAGAAYEVAMESGDALAVDDRAAGVAPRRELHGICLVTRGNPPLERALAADPSVRLRTVSHAAYSGPLGDDVVIVDGPGLLSRTPDNAAYLFIGTPDPFGWCVKSELVAAKPISHWAGEHPSLLDVDPTLCHVSRLLKTTWSGKATVSELVNADNLPVVVEAHAAGAGHEHDVRHLFWLFDLADSDLPRRLSFPLLLWNAIDFLASGGQDAAPDSTLTGRPLHVIARSDSTPTVTDPAGHPLALKPAAVDWLVPDTFHQGIYHCTDTGEAFAVNLLSDRGTLALPPEETPSHDSAPAVAGATLSLSPWARFRNQLSWRLVLIAAGTFALVEWVLFNRRLIRIG